MAVLLTAVMARVGTIYAQYGDKEKLTVTVMTDSDTKTVEGAEHEDFAEAMQRVVEEGAIDREGADEIVESLEGDGPLDVWRYDGGTDGLAEAVRRAVGDGVISQSLADEIMESVEEGYGGVSASADVVIAMNDVKSFAGTGLDGLAETMRQAEEAGAIAREEVERLEKLIESLEGDGSARMWRYEGEPGGLVEAVREAVEEGEISQDLAEMILDGFDGRDAGG